jgi:hypothetical protein
MNLATTKLTYHDMCFCRTTGSSMKFSTMTCS